MKQQTYIVFVLLLLGNTLFAREPLRLSLSEAYDYAMENNLMLRNARLNVDYSDRQIKGTIAQGLPQIDASLDYMTYFNYELTFPFGGGGGTGISEDQSTQIFMDAMDKFPGANPQTILASAYIDSKVQTLIKESGSTSIPLTDQSTAAVQVGQLLFSGQYWVGIQAARLAKKIAEKGLENSILDVKESVSTSYYMALVTSRSLDIFQKNIDNLKEIKGHTQKMYENGIAEQTDVDQISIQVSMLENTQRSMKRALDMSYSLLRFQLGAEEGTPVELTDNLESFLTSVISMSGLASFSPENNILYQMTTTQEEISEKMVDMERWAYSPTLTGFYSYNYKILKSAFDMNPNHLAGFSMSIPVFSGGSRKHKLEQAKIQLDQARINRSLIENQLTMQEQQRRLDLYTAIENYTAQTENVEVAKRAFKSIKNKFDQGMVSSLDLTQANSNYLQAETSLIQSVMSLLQAKLTLDKLYNQL